jgi:hypothetical protein
MSSKRSVLRTEATGENIGAGITPIDPGALSGPLVSASFVVSRPPRVLAESSPASKPIPSWRCQALMAG